MEVDYSSCKTPGQLILALLRAKGWTQKTLAMVLDEHVAGLNRLITGQKAIDAGTALALEELFGVDADKFLELQKTYDLAKARLSAQSDPKRATRALLFGGLPVAEMIKRGWLGLETKDIRNVEKVENALSKFFGVTSVDEIEILPHAAKKTQVAADVTPVQIAWLYRVREIASEMLVAKYSVMGVHSAIKKLKALLSAPQEARKVPRILRECGIRFVIVESLPGAKIDGVCFWLNDVSPVIGMTLRFDRIDNFWFVLRHELEHVLRLHGRNAIMLDVELEGDKASSTSSNVPEEEQLANQAAEDFCIPKKQMESFIARKDPFFAEQDILGFARTLNVHPGLIAGQLRHHTKRFDRFTNHLVKIKAEIAPTADVDGWGDVYPTGN